ncbi:MAG TPA: acetyl-CoA C-acyltransferase [bacterium]|nr:acetyl-CoA C-acyltransferase [bacterium]
MDPVYIVGATRTPIGRFGGTLAKFSAVELGVAAARAAIARAGVDPRGIAESVIGHARQAGCGPNPARQIAIRAGLPDTIPAATINQACASGLRAIALAHDAIRLGRADMVLAGGTESMSNTPYLLTRARFGYRLGHGELLDGNYQDGFFCPLADQLMGRTAETLAERYAISRDEQDEYALRSQQRAAAARAHWQTEIAPVMVADRKQGMIPFSTDEHVRGETTRDDLRQLAPVFKDHGSVTAGNSSAITDAAAAMLIVSGEAVQQHGLTPQARIVDYTVVGVDPKVMGLGPVPAIRQLLERTRIPLAKIDLIELNEAFAAQVIACDRELHLDMERTNVNGGAIALGHPIGCSGARIVVTLVHEMNRRQSRYGLAALCVSGGMGMAMLLEKP